MAVAKKIQDFASQSSWIRKMFEEGLILKQKYGAENVFDFTLGNPNIPPPPEFKKVLQNLLDEEIPNMHGYMPNVGYDDTRTAVAACIRAAQNVPLEKEHIVMTCGAAGALNVALKVILDPLDEVIVPSPFFMEYRFYIDNANGKMILVPTKEDFSLDMEAMEKAITEKTKAVILTSPNNPTGKIYDASSLAAFAALLQKKNEEYGHTIYLLVDEPYREIVFDGIQVPSLLNSYPHCISASSYSKTLSIPGERIGYLAVNPAIDDYKNLMDGLALYNRVLGFVNAPAFMQRAITRMQGIYVDVEQYKRKRDLLCEGLLAVGYDIKKPEGAFYLFLKTPIEDDVAFVRALQKRQILAVPGQGFGGPGHIRLAFCVDDATITRAMDGFAATLKDYR
ncbi:MAG: pyridoxal phosphate-dependent aminotransferase [Syntrophobacterales bacterium]|jgi:aspartate aminotransferase|nr:pyridoxal phosphate-dependent aminotransferase [Syntrophobacterales bacterium]